MACCRSFVNCLVFVLALTALFATVFFTTNDTEGALASTADANFDNSPLNIRECTARPQESCTPASLDTSDCAFLSNTSGEYFAKRTQTYITLVCGEDATKDVFKKQTAAISKRSKHRAVSGKIQNEAVLDPEVIQPIRQKIVVLKIKNSIDNILTFRIGMLEPWTEQPARNFFRRLRAAHLAPEGLFTAKKFADHLILRNCHPVSPVRNVYRSAQTASLRCAKYHVFSG
ncbi:uncharacterized protein LOC129596346 [Paramacrobiotus metropolitanus]|uniref:uncharacterized protein LOC129596346 n=1 Tax=Paramacrobiotus metropolitanus TaxID=2943436 RepID=UPI002445CA39|nr:uncharacterized protein LOC129596346 [Paramacrobiotus metropolitanus]